MIQSPDFDRPRQNTLHVQGVILLVAITLIAGSTFPLIKATVDSLTPATLIATRFAVAAVIFAPALRGLNAKLLRDGILLGLLLFTTLATEVVALETIDANRGGFISSLSVVLVPLLGLLLGQKLRVWTFVGAALALTGIGVMTWEGGSIGMGDFVMFCQPLAYAIYILLLEFATQHHPPLSLTAVQLLVIAMLGAIWGVPELVGQLEAIGQNYGVILYLAVVATVASTWLQAIAQRWVKAHETALIYTLEPVSSAFFSFWLLGENFGVRGLLGAGLVLAAIVLSQSMGKSTGQDSELQVNESVVPAPSASDAEAVSCPVVASNLAQVGDSVATTTLR